MSSGPCLVLCLEAPDAIRKWRDLMGATDPAKADAGTLRKEFGASIDNNATHGSDAPGDGGLRAGVLLPRPGAALAAPWVRCSSSSARSSPRWARSCGWGCRSAVCRATSLIERDGFRLYMPITTSIVVSVAFMLVSWLFRR